MDPIELREKTLAAYVEARRLADGGDAPAFEAVIAAFKKLDAQYRKATGYTGTWDEQLLGVGLRDMTGNAIPFPGGQAGAPGIPAAHRWHGADVAGQFIEALAQRGGFSGFSAALVTGGSVPVTVPVATQPVLEPRSAIFVADVIPEEDAPSGMFKFFEQTVRTNNAAPVAAGARKPTSIYTLAPREDKTETIAHLSEPVNRADLDDASMLRAFLEAEMAYGTRQGLDAQILNGDASGSEFLGFLDPASGIQDQIFDTDVLVTTRKAITMLDVVDVLNPTSWVLNPEDWEAIELQASADYAANPNQPTAVDRMARRLWGIGVVVSNAIAAGTGLLGDFRGYAKLYRTGGLRFDWSENVYRADLGDGNPGTDFERNMLVFRSELRANLAILRPDAFVKVDLAVGS